MIIYLAEAIDRNEMGTDGINRIKHKVMSHLSVVGVPAVIFCPALAFTNNRQGRRVYSQFVIGLNFNALHLSDVLVVIYHKDIESWGVPIELGEAARLNKHIIILDEAGLSEYDLPMYLLGIGMPVIVHSPVELAEKLVDLFLKIGGQLIALPEITHA